MKGKFPSDLLLVVFGPIFVTVIALSIGSLIYHAGQLGHDWMMFVGVAVGFVALLLLLLGFRRRHRASSTSSSNASDKSTPTI
jgi:protein-S-isoprenylcysteine O-methyltransferase Ste14